MISANKRLKHTSDQEVVREALYLVRPAPYFGQGPGTPCLRKSLRSSPWVPIAGAAT